MYHPVSRPKYKELNTTEKDTSSSLVVTCGHYLNLSCNSKEFFTGFRKGFLCVYVCHEDKSHYGMCFLSVIVPICTVIYNNNSFSCNVEVLYDTLVLHVSSCIKTLKVMVHTHR